MLVFFRAYPVENAKLMDDLGLTEIHERQGEVEVRKETQKGREIYKGGY